MLNITKASAGSGKTFALAQEYITLLLGYSDRNGRHRLYGNDNHREGHRKILAITFTNKATEEMKQRIVKELDAIAFDYKSDYIEHLCNYYNVGEPEIREAAKNALYDLLFNFTDFNVSTIDSFFQIILRTFAHEADVNEGFNIEMNSSAVLSHAVHKIIDSLRRSSDSDISNVRLRNWLSQYMQNCINESSSWNVFKENSSVGDPSKNVFVIAEFINTEQFKDIQEEFVEYLADKSRLSEFLKAMSSRYKDLESAASENVSKIVKILNECKITEDDCKSNMTVSGIIKQYTTNRKVDISGFEKLKGKVGLSWLKKAAIVKVATCENEITNILENCVDIYNEVIEIKSMRSSIYALGLIGDIFNNIKEFREENEVVLLSDTNELLNKIINEEDAPFIYERIGMMLKHFLIDEFQDTSRLQWVNMRPLVAESLSHNYENLIIGDEKQSIYRFRNADPSLLREQVFIDFDRQISEKSKVTNFSTNYRSRENLIRFNNTIFTLLASKIGNEIGSNLVADTYSNIVQYVDEGNIGRGGYVKMNFLQEANEVKWKDLALSEMGRTINEILTRGYSQKDIAILVNTHSEGAEVIKYLLNLQSGINVISDESLYLKNAVSVKLVVSMLEYLSNSISTKIDNSILQSEIDNIPMILHRYNSDISNGCDASEALVSAIKKGNEQFKENLLNIFNSPVATLYSTVEIIIEKFVPESIKESEAAYISAFQDIIIEYSGNQLATIPAFLKWWKQHREKLSVTSPQNADAINILTIHKSKGLEYPCVLIPFCEWDMCKESGILWFDSSVLREKYDENILPPVIPMKGTVGLEGSSFRDEYLYRCSQSIVDTLNKTYVAFTRAVDELYLYVPANSSKGKLGTHLKAVITAIEREALAKAKDATCDELFIDMDRFAETLTVGDETQKGLPVKPKKENVSGKKEKPKVIPKAFTVNQYDSYCDINQLKFDAPESEQSARRQGIKLHKIMSMIKYCDDVEFVVRRCAARGMVRDAEIDSTIAQFKGYISQTEPSEWFRPGNKIIAERPMLDNGNVLRCDRIVIRPDGSAIVIDFKFGKKYSSSYKHQVSGYINVLKRCGFDRVEGKIWFPETGNIYTV